MSLDCFRLLADLERVGINNSEVARRLSVSRSAVQGWKVHGSEPTWTTGQALLKLHAESVTPSILRDSVSTPEAQSM